MLLGASINAGAQSRSDILIVLDNDGISYTAQHTMIADDELVTTKLPAKRETLETVFSGPGSTLYRRAHEKDPDEITLVSGTVFTRFRHRFNGSALTTDTGSGPSSDASTNTEIDNDTSTGPIYSASLDQIKTSVKNLESFVYNVSWLLPSNIELLSYKPIEVAQSNSPTASFTWQQNGPVVTFTQTGGTPAIPSIEYRIKVNTQDQELPADIDCQPAQPGSEDSCIADTDLDSVPDYRDLCINADKTAGDSKPAVRPTESLGCDDDEVIELSELIFESGQSYLNVKARSQLDKVAIALQNLPELRYQIATFTDSAGNQQENQRWCATPVYQHRNHAGTPR